MSERATALGLTLPRPLWGREWPAGPGEGVAGQEAGR